jgi:hypothetical protein
MPFLLIPLTTNRRRKRYLCLLAISLAIAILGVAEGCGGGGSAGGSTPPPVTHQVTSSGTVTLKVQ